MIIIDLLTFPLKWSDWINYEPQVPLMILLTIVVVRKRTVPQSHDPLGAPAIGRPNYSHYKNTLPSVEIVCIYIPTIFCFALRKYTGEKDSDPVGQRRPASRCNAEDF